MMAPGLLSKGGRLPDGLPAGALVAIHAEGKEVACGIGKLVASSEEIKKSGKGVAVEVFCYIGYVYVGEGIEDGADCFLTIGTTCGC
jgi:PUA domain protein